MKSRKTYTIPFGLIAIVIGIFAQFYSASGDLIKSRGRLAVILGALLIGFELLEIIRARKN
jgi:hypothetical protein